MFIMLIFIFIAFSSFFHFYHSSSLHSLTFIKFIHSRELASCIMWRWKCCLNISKLGMRGEKSWGVLLFFCLGLGGWWVRDEKKCLSIKLNHPLTCDVMMCAIGFSHARTILTHFLRFLIFFDFFFLLECGENKIKSLLQPLIFIFRSINCITECLTKQFSRNFLISLFFFEKSL
jgi:hypothetical protein